MRLLGVGVGCAVALAGCGRFDFAPSEAASDATDVDAPPLPTTLVCSAVRIPIPSLSPESQLAVEAAGPGLRVLWTDANHRVQALAFDPAGATPPPRTLLEGPIDAIAGLHTTPMTTLVVTTTGTQQTLWSAPSLTSPTVVRIETSAAAHAPIVTDDTQVPRVWVRSVPAAIRTTYVYEDGTLGPDLDHPYPAGVVAVGAANQPNHLHIVWTEGDAASTCFQSDLDVLTPGNHVIPGRDPIGTDCGDFRIDSGPGNADSIFSARVGAGGAIELSHRGAGVDVGMRLSERGRAPRVRFDGTQFWVAWIDETAGDVLRVAVVGQGLTVQSVGLPGWMPVGNAAFDLVRVGGIVQLVALSADHLSILQLCP